MNKQNEAARRNQTRNRAEEIRHAQADVSRWEQRVASANNGLARARQHLAGLTTKEGANG